MRATIFVFVIPVLRGSVWPPWERAAGVESAESPVIPVRDGQERRFSGARARRRAPAVRDQPRLTGNAATNARASPSTSEPPEDDLAEPAAIAPGTSRTIALSTISMTEIETVSARGRRGRLGKAARRHGRVAGASASSRRRRPARRRGQPTRGCPSRARSRSRAEDLADRTSGEAMPRRGECDAVRRLRCVLVH